MKTAVKAIAACVCTALLSVGTTLPTQAASRLTAAPTGETAVEETESAEVAPVVAAAIAAMKYGTMLHMMRDKTRPSLAA